MTLSPYQKEAFARWAHGPPSRDPLYFFLVNDGTAATVTCPETVGMCRDDSEREWLEKCEAVHGMGACRLYAVYGSVVWDFDGPRDPSWTNYTARQPRTP